MVCPAGKQCETGSAEDCRQGYYCPEGTYQATEQCPSGRFYEKLIKFSGCSRVGLYLGGYGAGSLGIKAAVICECHR